MSRLVIMMMVVFAALSANAQKYTVESYINEFKYIAMDEMEKTGIPASITLAQGILESRYGNSELTLASNNHFGIKCHSGWTGKKYYHDDDRRNECFRVYKNPEQSFRDHSEFLVTRSRYDFLFDYSSTDYKRWAHGLRKAGYATNPKYGNLLVDLIERHQLYLYDRPGRNAIARSEHNNRNVYHDVKSSRDYKMHDNTVHSKTSVQSGVSDAIFSYNHIRTVAAGKYDDIRSISDRHVIPAKRLMKYNDLKPGDAISEGQLIYLQPKRARSDQRIHVVEATDQTMWYISQKYGVKLYKLRNRNLMSENEEPALGQTVYLNKKTDNKPMVRKHQPMKPDSRDEVVFEIVDIDNDIEEIIIHEESVANPQPKVVGTYEPAANNPTQTKDDVVVVRRAKIPADDPYEPVAVPRKKPGDEELMREAALEKPVIYKKEDAIVETSAIAKLDSQDNDLSSGRKLHTVIKGDTLYSISKQYSIEITDIKAWNKLESNLISIDQTLIVSE